MILTEKPEDWTDEEWKEYQEWLDYYEFWDSRQPEWSTNFDGYGS